MELVEGEDLSERIKRGPIPVNETIPINTSIPVNLTVPIEVKVEGSELATLAASLRLGLISLRDVLAGLG